MYSNKFYRMVRWLTGKVVWLDVVYLYKMTFAICALWMMMLLLFFVTRPGWYLRGVDLLYCTSPAVCLHETAHRMDWRSGNVSRSPQYLAALAEFSRSDHAWSAIVRDYRGSTSELYAQMYEAARGDLKAIPEGLQIFYQMPQ